MDCNNILKIISLNEIKKNRIGLLIDILEKNEIHNYANDIFYANQE